MESRMEKHYKQDLTQYERSKKNANLYKEVYGVYDKFDNLPIPENTNEIDLTNLKTMVTSRDEYQKLKEHEKITNIKEDVIEVEAPIKRERKVYDINELLNQAKQENAKLNDKINPKIESDLNFLVDLDSSDPSVEIEKPSMTEVSYHTKQISVDPKINQIIDTSSLPLDILTDLKPTDDTIISEPIKEETRALKQMKKDLGTTFYSGSYTFSKKDFSETNDEEKPKSKNGIKIILLIFGLTIIVVTSYLLIKYYIA